MQLNKVIDNLFYGMDRVKARKERKTYEELWYKTEQISELSFELAFEYLKQGILSYLLSLKYLFKSLKKNG